MIEGNVNLCDECGSIWLKSEHKEPMKASENNEKYISIEEIKALYEEMYNRPSGDSYFTKYDGTRITLDTGYAFEGMELFIEELENKIKQMEGE